MWHRFIGAGIELASFAVVATLAGYGFDRWLNNDRLLFTAICGMVGFALGMVRFIVLANRANRSFHDSAVHPGESHGTADDKPERS